MKRILTLLFLFLLLSGCQAGLAKTSGDDHYTVFTPDGKILFVTTIPISVGDQFYDGTNWYEVSKVRGMHGFAKQIPVSQSVDARLERQRLWGTWIWSAVGVAAVLLFFFGAFLVLLYMLHRKSRKRVH